MSKSELFRESVRGSKWVSPLLLPIDLRILGLVLGLSALLRGVDYHIHPELTNLYSLVEDSLPWVVLSWWCYIGGALLLLGYLFNRHFVVFVGHSVMAVLGSGLTVGSLFTLTQELLTTGVLPPYGPLSRMILMLIPTLLHLALLVRMGPLPPEVLKAYRERGQG